MKIAIISDWFTEGMGYAENMLPKSLSELGHDVYLLTSNGKTYFTHAMYETVYAPFLGPNIIECYVRKSDGFTVHRLPHKIYNGRIWIDGLYKTLKDISPDVVQVFEITPMTTLYSAWWSRKLKYKLFSESRMHASVFYTTSDACVKTATPRILDRLNNAKSRVKLVKKKCLEHGIAPAIGKLIERSRKFVVEKTMHRYLANQLIKRAEKCYPISQDVYNILIDHFNWPKEKLCICPLGVDTDLFYPSDNEKLQKQRIRLRTQLGFGKDEVVCVYSGRFTLDKAPLTLALAVNKLADQGLPFRGLFIGVGDREYTEKIHGCKGCVIHPFVETKVLPSFYRAADVGVWPKQESTSQLDAMACGLPLILSDKVMAKERVAGNALTYREGDYESLAEVLKLMASGSERRRMGELGAQRVRRELSWRTIAARRIEDYRYSLRRH